MADKTEVRSTGDERSTTKSTKITAATPVKSEVRPTTATKPTVAPVTPSRSEPPEIKPPPTPSPRTGVLVNVASVTSAVHTSGRARSIAAIQRALVARGFEPGRTDGLADHGTRAAYAKYQRSIGERGTGVPTADSLNVLGFDVAG